MIYKSVVCGHWKAADVMIHAIVISGEAFRLPKAQLRSRQQQDEVWAYHHDTTGARGDEGSV